MTQIIVEKDYELPKVGQDEGPQDQEKHLEEGENEGTDGDNDRKAKLTYETKMEHNESRE